MQNANGKFQSWYDFLFIFAFFIFHFTIFNEV